MTAPILMTEEYWMNSHLSVARFYGGITFNNKEYLIVNKQGITLIELSDPTSKHYVHEGKAIPPGEPADLILKEWIPVYKRLGRERTIELIKDHVPLKDAKKLKK